MPKKGFDKRCRVRDGREGWAVVELSNSKSMDIACTVVMPASPPIYLTRFHYFLGASVSSAEYFGNSNEPPTLDCASATHNSLESVWLPGQMTMGTLYQTLPILQFPCAIICVCKKVRKREGEPRNEA